jgi:phage replication-related protein YjqB (UPF0714/DUF867 family)
MKQRPCLVLVPESRIAIIAPHGGGIEPGSSTIARAIAGEDINMYLFEGIKVAKGNAIVHIASHHFDEPRCLGEAVGTLFHSVRSHSWD